MLKTEIVFSVLATGFLFWAPVAVAQCGDVNGDSQVTVGDSLLVLQEAVGLDPGVVCDDALAELTARVEQLETLLAAVSIDGDTVVLTGVNLQVVSGAGATDEEPNGTGNIIVGYDEDEDDDKSGSHYIVVGPGHSYSASGGMVLGVDNASFAVGASVLGGEQNAANQQSSVVVGGRLNQADAAESVVVGGVLNKAQGARSVISSGERNLTRGFGSHVGGGRDNIARGNNSHVSGGRLNDAAAAQSVVGGGQQRRSTNTSSWVAGLLFQVN
jgi:hypothetical protein